MDICGKDFWVEQQCGREYVRDAGELIALVPGEFSEHGLLRGHNEGDDNAQTWVAATEFVVGQCGRNRRPRRSALKSKRKRDSSLRSEWRRMVFFFAHVGCAVCAPATCLHDSTNRFP